MELKPLLLRDFPEGAIYLSSPLLAKIYSRI